jgi:hypothetical protein
MLSGVDHGNVDSRRAYSLDGRTSWVESMHTTSGHVVGKDNRVLGPGEYMPGLPNFATKHIPSPALGGSRGIVDHFHPFKSMLSTRTPGNTNSLSTKMSSGPVGPGSVVSFDDASSEAYFAVQAPAYSIATDVTRYHHQNKHEGTTIFHEHDRRLALDPKNRTTPTPGPGKYKTWSDTPLRRVSHHSGVTELNKTVMMGPDDIPFGERMDVRPALPEYDAAKAMDTEHFRRSVKLASFSPAERVTQFDIQKRRNMIEEGLIDTAAENRRRRVEKIKKLNGMYDPDESSMGLMSAGPSVSVGEKAGVGKKECPGARASGKKALQMGVRYPILKTRKPPTLVFDNSSYRDLSRALEKSLDKDQIELNPKNLDKEAKCGVFNEYLTMPRKHHGQRVPSRLSDKVKRVVF